MRFKILVWFFVFLLGCTAHKDKPLNCVGDKHGYFVPVNIAKFNRGGIPCIEGKIEGQSVCMGVDLGFRGEVALLGEVLDKLPNKSYVKDRKMYGFKGEKYLTPVYKIPKVQIGSATFHNLLTQKERIDFQKDATILKDGVKPSPASPGRIGWKFFRKTNLLLDLGKSQIAICNSVETFERQGYSTEKMVKVPLLLERGLVEIEGITSIGKMRFLLDTGCTCNHWHEEGAKPADVWNDSSLMNCSLKIGDSNFGSTKFRKIAINLPIHIDAILGMEFFKEHLVYLDFQNKCAYIQRHSFWERLSLSFFGFSAHIVGQ